MDHIDFYDKRITGLVDRIIKHGCWITGLVDHRNINDCWIAQISVTWRNITTNARLPKVSDNWYDIVPASRIHQ